jgi:hypothetical protein
LEFPNFCVLLHQQTNKQIEIMTDYNFLVDPETLIFRAESMNNWLHIKSKINNKDLNQIATEVAMSWTDDYADSGQGFGSSDGTFMLKEFLDDAIHFSKLDYKSDFVKNRLTIVSK